MRIAGLASVDVTGIENINVTEDVPGHMAYRAMMPTLLDKVGWAVESLEYTEIEDPDPENHEKRQRELINEIEEARRQLEEQPEKKGFKSFFSRKKNTQKKAWETYDERNAKVLEGDEKEAERLAVENTNVMFDVEAIRREALALAIQKPGDIEEIKKHLSVRELQSTLPALKVDLGKHEPSSSSSTPMSATRPTLAPAHSQSHDGTTSNKPIPTNGTHDKDEGEGEISMTFESPERPHTSFNTRISDHGSGSAPVSRYATPEPRISRTATPDQTGWNTSRKATPEPQKPDVAWDQPRPKFGVADRPAHRSVTSPLPVTSPVLSSPEVDVNYNPWDAEDPEFGKEKEIEMTF